MPRKTTGGRGRGGGRGHGPNQRDKSVAGKLSPQKSSSAQKSAECTIVSAAALQVLTQTGSPNLDSEPSAGDMTDDNE